MNVSACLNHRNAMICEISGMQALENVDAGLIFAEMKRFLIGIHALAYVSLRFVHLDIIGMKTDVNADACTQPILVQTTVSGMTVSVSVFALNLKPVLACPAITGIMNAASACVRHLKPT